MKWFYNFRLTIKLLISFTIVAVILIVVGGKGLLNTYNMAKLSESLYKKNFLPSLEINKLNRLFYEYRLLLFQHIGDSENSQSEANEKLIISKTQEISIFLAEKEKLVSDNQNFDFEELKKQWGVLKKDTNIIVRMSLDYLKNGAFDKSQTTNKDYFQDINSTLLRWSNIMEKNSKIDFEMVDVIQKDSFYFMLILVIGGVLIGFVLMIWISHIISKPILTLTDFVIHMTKSGDFSKTINQTSKDEIGQSIDGLNQLTESLRSAFKNINEVMSAVARGDLIQRITETYSGEIQALGTSINKSIDMLSESIRESKIRSEQVNISANALSKTALSLSSGASEQAASLEEIASSMDEIGFRAKTNNKRASKAQTLSNETLEEVRNGTSQMENMLSSMREINQTSSNVTKVIKVIEEIAFQTNLLALNAAVEAARAGKYGKGFAVVADEVRNLAERSAEAAKNTNELIENSVKEVENGVLNADQTAAVLKEISNDVNQVNELVGEISAASQEQNSGIDEVNRSLAQMNNIVQQNSSIAEETASSSEELKDQSTRLQMILSKFVILRRNSATGQMTIEESSFSESQNDFLLENQSNFAPLHPQLKLKKEPQDPNQIIALEDDDYYTNIS
ncbi:MAG: HAMP domain-containing protein [Deltaproteobacteria bacterium]|jgi:methyl-accepting chemotaxis protein|nr:HAMP domain-containing protein [Deltaproteobacteria bacterium]